MLRCSCSEHTASPTDCIHLHLRGQSATDGRCTATVVARAAAAVILLRWPTGLWMLPGSHVTGPVASNLSISMRSSVLSFQSAAWMCASICAGRFAPTMHEVTAGLASVQAMASSTSV